MFCIVELPVCLTLAVSYLVARPFIDFPKHKTTEDMMYNDGIKV